MKIVPEEKDENYKKPCPLCNANDIRGFNTCRQTVLNNLKSKEMVEGIQDAMVSTLCGEVCINEDLQKTALAIQKALIGKK